MKGIQGVATAVMKVPGMSKPGRVRELRREMGSLDGVLHVEINYILDSVTVKYDAGKLTSAQVKKKLKSSSRAPG